MLINILYLVSGILWAVEMIPQLMKIYNRKSVKDISIYFPLICIISMALYLVASYLSKNWVLIISIIGPFICNIILLIQCIYYREKVTKTLSGYWLCWCGQVSGNGKTEEPYCWKCGSSKTREIK